MNKNQLIVFMSKNFLCFSQIVSGWSIGFVAQRFHNYMIFKVLIIFWSKIKFIQIRCLHIYATKPGRFINKKKAVRKDQNKNQWQKIRLIKYKVFFWTYDKLTTFLNLWQGSKIFTYKSSISYDSSATQNCFWWNDGGR